MQTEIPFYTPSFQQVIKSISTFTAALFKNNIHLQI